MISNRCQYALRAVLDLAGREGGPPAPIAEIAAAQKIPQRFLEVILRQLKQNGITDSFRGKDGGYRLARPAGEITMADVVRVFEGPLVAGREADEGEDQFRFCGEVFEDAWREADAKVDEVLRSVTFKQLAERQAQLRARFVTDWSI